MTELFAAAFVTFFVVIDAPGVTPIFASLTQEGGPAHRRAMAFKSVIIAAFVLVGFAYGGDWLLNQLHVSLDAFRIAGGILLFLMALDMLFEKRTERREQRAEALMHEPHEKPQDVSVFPMAIPMMAGPGAIATVLLYMNEHDGVASQLIVLAAAGANLLLCLVMFLASGLLMRLMGDTIATVVTRILGLILAALSTQFVIDGVGGAFGLSGAH